MRQCWRGIHWQRTDTRQRTETVSLRLHSITRRFGYNGVFAYGPRLVRVAPQRPRRAPWGYSHMVPDPIDFRGSYRLALRWLSRFLGAKPAEQREKADRAMAAEHTVQNVGFARITSLFGALEAVLSPVAAELVTADFLVAVSPLSARRRHAARDRGRASRPIVDIRPYFGGIDVRTQPQRRRRPF